MNRRGKPFALVASLVGLIAACAAGLDAQEWTRFRGPNGSGISDAKTVPVEWSEDDYNWVAELPGVGHSSPVVWGDKIFVTSADEEARQFYVLCLDAKDGSVRWRQERGFGKVRHHSNNSAASNTPACDAERVYVLQQTPTESPLIAYDHEGNRVWRYDLGPYRHGQGGATSPIVYEGLVIVANDHKEGSYLLAVDRETGAERWKIPRAGERACYATPCVYGRPGRPDEIIFTHCYEGIWGVDPATGKTNWTIDPFGRFPQRAIASPIVHCDLIIATSGFTTAEKNLVAVRPAGAGAEEVYRISRQVPHVPSVLVYEGRLYMWSDTGIVTCADADTGEKIWQKRVGGNQFGSPVCVDGKLYCVELEGEVIVLEAGDEYKLLARNDLGQPSRATPAVSGGVLYLRSYSHLFSVGGER